MLTPQWNAWVKAFSGIVTVGLSYHLVFENEYNGQFGEHGKEHVFSPVRSGCVRVCAAALLPPMSPLLLLLSPAHAHSAHAPNRSRRFANGQVRRIVQAQKDKFFGVDQAAIDAPTAVDE
jgi:hypothetical protein